MGVPQILSEVLPVAGRKINLRDYSDGIFDDDFHKNSKRRRKLRIGLDVSTWIHRACKGHGDILCDERHLSNKGRSELLVLAAEAEKAKAQQQEVNENNDGETTTTTATNNPKQAVYNAANVQKFRVACTKYVITRIQTLRNESNADILVVFDGTSPPIKLDEVRSRSTKRKEAERARDAPVDVVEDNAENDDTTIEQAQEQRVKANRRAGAGPHYADVLSDILMSLRSNKIAFLVSPYESDGQLAYLANCGYIDLIVTEDSDMMAYYGNTMNAPILYKLSDSISSGVACGTLLRYDDITMVIRGSSSPSLDLSDFTPCMLAVLMACAGGDYCRSLKGIGLVSACKIVRNAFFTKPPKGTGKKKETSRSPSPLEIVLNQLFETSWEKDSMSREDKIKYRQNFLAALIMYRHPVVYDPMQHKCIRIGDTNGGQQVDPELESYGPYMKLYNDKVKCERDITGPLIKPNELAKYIAEGWISSRSKKPYKKNDPMLPACVLTFLKREEDDDDEEVPERPFGKKQRATTTSNDTDRDQQPAVEAEDDDDTKNLQLETQQQQQVEVDSDQQNKRMDEDNDDDDGEQQLLETQQLYLA